MNREIDGSNCTKKAKGKLDFHQDRTSCDSSAQAAMQKSGHGTERRKDRRDRHRLPLFGGNRCQRKLATRTK